MRPPYWRTSASNAWASPARMRAKSRASRSITDPSFFELRRGRRTGCPRLARGCLRLRGAVVRRQGLMERAVSGLVSGKRGGELEPLLRHLLDEFGNGSGSQRTLAREVLPYLRLAQGLEGLVE